VVLFYLTMIVMGLAQQMALFHTVASGLIAVRPDHFMQFESSLTFMSCLLGLVLCFPLATEVTICLFLLSLVFKQGGQVGRIFACWASVFFGQHF
jgi:hypothetical protein